MKRKIHNKLLLLTGSGAFVVLALVLALSRAPASGSAPQSLAPAKEEPRVERSSAAVAKPTTSFTVSNSRAAVELARNIDRAIDESEFARARWGIFAMSLRDGRVLYARNADRAFTPASNMKLYTTAVALDLLGADYRWRTSVYARAEPDASGAIAGDLTLYGRGAPDLASHASKDRNATLAQLADELYSRGVRRVRGQVVGDESYFRGDPLGNGWLWNDVQWYFGAEASALSINDNEVVLTITPASEISKQAELKLTPATDFLHITNDTATVERGAQVAVGITRGLSDNELRAWGEFPAGGRSFGARIAVHGPALWAARLFRDALIARGIAVEGAARVNDARVRESNRFDPQGSVELASISGQTLGEIVRRTNKESINLNAELILRTLGKERGALAPDPDPRRMSVRGDDEAGTAIMRLWLRQAGIATDELALHDGSGLSRLDLVTPEATARLLAIMIRRASANVFQDSLPIAGRDGTLAGRLQKVAGRISAKTGTITYVNSLSGYATTADDEPLVFSIICNEETERSNSTQTIDSIAALLARYKE